MSSASPRDLSFLGKSVSSIRHPRLSKNFFLTEIKPQCENGCEIAEVFVGKTKDSLDLVNYELAIFEVAAVFCQFVKSTIRGFSGQDQRRQ